MYRILVVDDERIEREGISSTFLQKIRRKRPYLRRLMEGRL